MKNFLTNFCYCHLICAGRKRSDTTTYIAPSEESNPVDGNLTQQLQSSAGHHSSNNGHDHSHSHGHEECSHDHGDEMQGDSDYDEEFVESYLNNYQHYYFKDSGDENDAENAPLMRNQRQNLPQSNDYGHSHTHEHGASCKHDHQSAGGSSSSKAPATAVAARGVISADERV